jgi:hypothetical protein
VAEPNKGTAGIDGCGLIVLLVEFNEVHPFAEAVNV